MEKELLTVLIAMAPTIEAHGAIATAIGLFKFSAVKAFFLASAGTTIISPLLLIFWHALADFLSRKIYFINRFLNWLFAYTRRRHADRFENIDSKEKRAHLLKAFALYVFVAIPGPLTGVWAGSVAAYVFGVPFWYSFFALVLGAVSVAFLDALAIGGFFSLIR